MIDERHRTLAELLRTERERRNQSVEELATALRISPEKLQRIESGDSSDFPSALYFSLFCKSYAEMLGIDYVRTMDAMAAESAAQSPEKDAPATDTRRSESRHSFAMPPPPTTQTTPPRSLITGVVIGAAVIALVILVWRLLTGSGDSSSVPDKEVRVDTVSIAPVEFLLVAKEPTFAVVAVGRDTVLAKKLESGEQYAYTGRQALQISVANGSAVRTYVNDWEVDLVDHQTGMIGARMIRPDKLLPLLSTRSPQIVDSTLTATDSSKTPEVNQPSPAGGQ